MKHDRRLLVVGAAALAVAAVPAVSAAQDSSALVETVQSKLLPIRGAKVRSAVGQAAITQGGRLIVRFAARNRAGVAGEDVPAQTSRKIPDTVSEPTKANLKITIKRNHTGTVTVIGPKNATQPDSVVFTYPWTVRKPKIRITGAGA